MLALVAIGLGAVRLVDRRRAALVAGIAAGIAGTAVAVFYAWQPLRFLATGPSNDTFGQYLEQRWIMLPDMWRTYWGKLGWLDYNASAGWYGLMLALLRRQHRLPDLAAAPAHAPGVVPRRRSGSCSCSRRSPPSCATCARPGYTFQGRYLLPAALGLGAVLLHEVRAARIALLAGVLALNLVLVRETVHRYYVDGWHGAVHALPFR